MCINDREYCSSGENTPGNTPCTLTISDCKRTSVVVFLLIEELAQLTPYNHPSSLLDYFSSLNARLRHLSPSTSPSRTRVVRRRSDPINISLPLSIHSSIHPYKLIHAGVAAFPLHQPDTRPQRLNILSSYWTIRAAGSTISVQGGLGLKLHLPTGALGTRVFPSGSGITSLVCRREGTWRTVLRLNVALATDGGSIHPYPFRSAMEKYRRRRRMRSVADGMVGLGVELLVSNMVLELFNSTSWKRW